MAESTDSAATAVAQAKLFDSVVSSAASLCLAFVGLATLWWPMGRDQGVFAWVGSVITHGGASYVDAWEVKGPATHLVYAFSQLLFGSGMWGIRLLDLLMLAAAAWLAWRALSRLGTGSGAWFGVCLFVAWYWMPGYWETAQPDTWVALFLLAALSLSAFEEGPIRPGVALAAGALIGLCAMLKPLFSCFGLILLICTWPRRDDERTAASWRSVGAALAGAAAVCLAVAAWMLLTGAMLPFLRIQFDFNWAVHRLSQPLTLSGHLGQWSEFASEPGLLLALPPAAVGAYRLWIRRRRFALATLAALLLSIAGIALQSKYYPYHFAPLLAPLAVLAGCGIAAVGAWVPGTRRVKAVVTTIVAAAIVLTNLWTLAPGTWSTARYVTGRLTAREYYGEFGAQKTDYDFLECRMAAERVREATEPDDPILVWALDPLIYYLAERLPPSRFGAHYPLTRGELNPYEAEWRREFMRDLEEHPPARIVIADHDQNNLLPKSSLYYIEDFPEFRAFLVESYKGEGHAGRFHILRRVE